MKIKNILTLSFATLTLCGCGSTTGSIGHSINTEVNLSQANFKVIASVTGEASATYILGIGFNQKNLTDQARRDMINKADLIGKSKAIINVTTDTRTRIGLFTVKKTVFVSGEVIEFIK